MNAILKYFKPFDYILIGLAVFISFLPTIVTTFNKVNTPDSVIAVVKIHGKVVDRFELVEGGPHQEVTYYPNEGQYNIVEIDGNQIRVKEDNSPDQIAVRTSWVHRPGQVSVCLPHQLLIELQESKLQNNEEDEEDLILPL